MSEQFPQLAAMRIELSEAGRLRHEQAIDRALARRPRAGRWMRGRRLALAAVAGVMLALPTAAIASVDAVPGEVLYPIKRLVEPLLALFDEDLPSRRRAHELKQLIETSADPAVIERARDALGERGADEFEDRMDEPRHTPGTPTTEAEGRTPASPTPASPTSRPDDTGGRDVTTTSIGDRRSSASTSTTRSESDRTSTTQNGPGRTTTTHQRESDETRPVETTDAPRSGRHQPGDGDRIDRPRTTSETDGELRLPPIVEDGLAVKSPEDRRFWDRSLRPHPSAFGRGRRDHRTPGLWSVDCDTADPSCG